MDQAGFLRPRIQSLDITTVASSPRAYRAHLLIDAGGGAAQFAPDPWQSRDFAALDDAWRGVTTNIESANGCSRAYLERPRGHSKTSDLAIMSLWALAFSRRQLYGVAAAADKDQARLLRDAIQRIVRLNPWLNDVIDVQQYRVTNTRTDSTLEILSSDAPTSYGLTPDFIVVDELANHRSPDLWHSLLSSAAKRPHCLLVIITNAGCGAGTSWQWRVRESCRTDPDWYFTRVAGPSATWISDKLLAEQRRLLPSLAYQRLWLNEWTQDGDALSLGQIESSIDATATPHTTRRQGYAYACGIDLSLSRDFSAVVLLAKSTGYTTTTTTPARRLTGTAAALADLGMLDTPREMLELHHHPGDQRVHLAGVRVWRPRHGKIDLAGVQDYLLRLHGTFQPMMLIDVYQAELLAQQLRRQGVSIEGVAFTPSLHNDMAAEVLSLFNDARISLYADDALLGDLRRAQIIDRASGVRLQWDRSADTGHGDAGTSFGLASLALKRRRPAARVVPRAVVMDDSWIEHGDAGYERAAVDERAAAQEVLEWLCSR